MVRSSPDSGRFPSNVSLCGLIWILLSYILIDFWLHQTPQLLLSPYAATQSVLQNQVQISRLGGAAEDSDCTTRDDFYEENVPAEQDPWSQAKWALEPAACRVRGEVIEKLDDENNFRRGFSLRYAENVEDRTHILPWMLGNKINLNNRKRRVYLDLGANSFSTSIQWFLQTYPVDFTEVHAFEIVSNRLRLPSPFIEETNWAAANGYSLRTKQKPEIPGWMLDRVRMYEQLVSLRDNPGTKEVNITRFMKQELQLQAQDTVIVKMDIEGSEWDILSSWMDDPDMVRIVDEIFVEVHYNHTSMARYNWAKFSHRRQEAKRFLADLRWKGFYAHFWP